MSRFSKSIKESLERNPNIIKVSSNLGYTFKFKKEAVKAYKSGASPKEIFRRANIDLSLFGTKYAKNSIWRWIRIVEKYGQYSGLIFSLKHQNETILCRKFEVLSLLVTVLYGSLQV